jgi:NADPH2:quinone reductase
MVQFGAAMGMRIIGGVTSAEKAVLAQENGAESTVDLAADNLRDSLRDEVYALTGGRIAIVGFASGRIPQIKANYLLVKRLTAIGSPLTSGQDVKDEAMAELFRLYRAGGVRPVISARVSFKDWREAFRRFKERRVTGKIVMVP